MADLPPYRHDPGRTPHPLRDPRGHSFGRPECESIAFDPTQAAGHPAFERGIELFDAGYFWEAHEAWEGPWRQCRRGSPAELFLRGLIQVAAALLKRRARNVRAAARLAERGFGRIAASGVTGGIDVGALEAAVYAALEDPALAAPRIPRSR